MRHGEVVLVQRQLATVDPGTEGEIARGDGQETRQHTRHDGADVGSVFSSGTDRLASFTRLGDDGPARGHGEQRRGARRDRTLRGRLDRLGDGRATDFVPADDLPHRLGDTISVASAEPDVTLVASHRLLLRRLLPLWVAARQSSELRFPAQRRQVEDIDAWAVARQILAYVAAHNHHLAVPHVAGVAGACRRIRLPLRVDGNPGEARNGEDPHVVVLLLLAVRNEVLAAVQVDIVGATVGGCSDDGAWIDPEGRCLATCRLLVPARRRNVENINDVELRLYSRASALRSSDIEQQKRPRTKLALVPPARLRMIPSRPYPGM